MAIAKAVKVTERTSGEAIANVAIVFRGEVEVGVKKDRGVFWRTEGEEFVEFMELGSGQVVGSDKGLEYKAKGEVVLGELDEGVLETIVQNYVESAMSKESKMGVDVEN
jgi:hypothetical protein